MSATPLLQPFPSPVGRGVGHTVPVEIPVANGVAQGDGEALSLALPLAIQAADAFCPEIPLETNTTLVLRQPKASPLLTRQAPGTKQTNAAAVSDAIGAFLDHYRNMLSPDARKLISALPRSSLTLQCQFEKLQRHLIPYMADPKLYAHHLRPLLKGLWALGLCLSSVSPRMSAESIMTLKEMDARPGVAFATETPAATTALGQVRDADLADLWSREDWVRSFRYGLRQPDLLAQLVQPLFYSDPNTLKPPQVLNEVWSYLGCVLDADELACVFGQCKTSQDLAAFFAAVYDEGYALRQPYLVIVLFSAFARYDRLVDVLRCLLEDEVLRPVGVHFLVESQIYLRFEQTQIVALCYEELAKDHVGWYPDFFDVLKHYAVTPEDVPVSWFGTDVLRAEERYLLAMARLGVPEERLNGLKELAGLAARKDTSLELREQMAVVLLTEWQTPETSAEMQAECVKGLKALQGRIVSSALTEAIPYALGPDLSKSLSIWMMVRRRDLTGLKGLVASSDPCQIEALAAYTGLKPDWTDLDLSHIRDWTRLPALIKYCELISLTPDQLGLIPERALKNLPNNLPQFEVKSEELTVAQWRLALSCSRSKRFSGIKRLSGVWTTHEISELFRETAGGWDCYITEYRSWRRVFDMVCENPVAKGSMKQWLLNQVEDLQSLYDKEAHVRFCKAVAFLLTKFGVQITSLPQEAQLHWALNCHHNAGLLPFEETLMILQQFQTVVLSTEQQALWDNTLLSMAEDGGQVATDDLKERMRFFSGPATERTLLNIAESRSFNPVVRKIVLTRLVQLLQEGSLLSVSGQNLREVLTDNLLNEPFFGLEIWESLSAVEDVAETLKHSVKTIIMRSNDARILGLCLKYMQNPANCVPNQGVFDQDVIFVKTRLAMMQLQSALAELFSWGMFDNGEVCKDRPEPGGFYQAFVLPAALAGIAVTDYVGDLQTVMQTLKMVLEGFAVDLPYSTLTSLTMACRATGQDLSVGVRKLKEVIGEFQNQGFLDSFSLPKLDWKRHCLELAAMAVLWQESPQVVVSKHLGVLRNLEKRVGHVHNLDGSFWLDVTRLSFAKMWFEEAAVVPGVLAHGFFGSGFGWQRMVLTAGMTGLPIEKIRKMHDEALAHSCDQPILSSTQKAVLAAIFKTTIKEIEQLENKAVSLMKVKIPEHAQSELVQPEGGAVCDVVLAQLVSGLPMEQVVELYLEASTLLRRAHGQGVRPLHFQKFFQESRHLFMAAIVKACDLPKGQEIIGANATTTAEFLAERLVR